MITKEYKRKLKNKNIKRLLLNKENIEPLEYFLEKEALELDKIENIKGSLDFGTKLKKNELWDIFEAVKQQVDSFLSVSDIPTPKFNYNSFFRPGVIPLHAVTILNILKTVEHITNIDIVRLITTDFWNLSVLTIPYLLAFSTHYNPLTKGIILGKKEKYKEIIADSAHEYTHLVQSSILNILNMINPKYRFFEEGHARGVERNIAKSYMEKKDDPAFIYGASKRTLKELSNMYLSLCKKFKIKSNEHLLNFEIIKSIQPSPYVDSYDIGSTFFYLNEKIHGLKIYNEIIHGKFKLD